MAFLVALAIVVSWVAAFLLLVVGGSQPSDLVRAVASLAVWFCVCLWTHDRARNAGWSPRRAHSPARTATITATILVALVVVVAWGLHERAQVELVSDQMQGSGTFTAGTTAEWPLPQGSATIFTASGHGKWQTIPFVLRGNKIFEVMSASNAVEFRLVEVGPSGTTTTADLVTSCRSACSNQRWNGPQLSGLFQLQVATPHASDGWTFSLQESRSRTFEFAAWVDPRGSELWADGTGTRRSKAFQLVGSHATVGLLLLGGDFHTTGRTTFYLVPAGQKLDRRRDLIFRTATALDGGWGNPQRPPGRYDLVVETVGEWSFTMGRP